MRRLPWMAMGYAASMTDCARDVEFRPASFSTVQLWLNGWLIETIPSVITWGRRSPLLSQR